MEQRTNSWRGSGDFLDRPNPARIYDYLLGGHHNFAADRAAAEKMIETLPNAAEGTAALRAFLRRAIGFFASEGIDQFLDIGSGLPTVGNVHDLARAVIPEARIVYVDIDPVVITHSSYLLRDVPGVTIVEGDLRRPREILENAEVKAHLDFDRPVALTMTAVFHFIVDDETAYHSIRTLVNALASGSFVAITHPLLEEKTRDDIEKAADDYKAAASVKARPREAILRLFDGLELLEPGVTRIPLWRPEASDDILLEDAENLSVLGGVGRKR